MDDEEQVWAYVIVSDLPLRTIVRRLRGKVERIRHTRLPGTIFVASTFTSTELTEVLNRQDGQFLILDTATDRGGILPLPIWNFLYAYDTTDECPKCNDWARR